MPLADDAWAGSKAPHNDLEPNPVLNDGVSSNVYKPTAHM